MRARLPVLIAAAGLALAACTSGAGAPSTPPAVPVTSVSAAPTTAPLAARPTRSTSHPRPVPPTRTRTVRPSRARTTAAPPSTATHSVAPPTVTHSVAPPRSRPLVVLDPGHNGGNATHTAEINRQVYAGFGQYKACNTTGTETNAGYPEHEFTWHVALDVRGILRAHGVRVIMTRHSDTGVGPCVNRRAAIQSEPGVDAAVAIHGDGAPSDGHGFHVNECSRTPEGATAATVARSKALGRAEHDALVRGSGLVPSTYIGTNGYVYRDDFAGLNLSRSPTTFLELGNMRNAHDAALQSSARGQHQIAAAVAAGILHFLGR